jgi:Domain of unknown function (DUF5668)
MMKSMIKLTMAIILVLVGVLLLLQNFGILNQDILKFWPAVLVIFGCVMFYEYFSDKRTPGNGIF